jgi:protein involved in polysaccharide export with SLBB domain
MSKISFALLSSLLVTISSYGHVNTASKSISGTSVQNYTTQDFGVDPSPQDAKKYYKQGVKYAGMKLYTEAVAAFELAILLKPNYEDAFLSLGRAYVAMGRLPEAIKAYRRVTQLNPNHDEAYARLREINAKLVKEEQRGFRPRRVSAHNEAPNAERVGLEHSKDSSDLKAANKVVNTAQRQSAYIPLNQRGAPTSKSTPDLKSSATGTRLAGSPTPSNLRSERVPSSSPNLSASVSANTKSKPPSNSGSSTTSLPLTLNSGSGRITQTNPAQSSVLNAPKKGDSVKTSETRLQNAPANTSVINHRPPPKTSPDSSKSSGVQAVRNTSQPIITRNIRTNPLLPRSSRGLNGLSRMPLDAGPIPKAFATNVRLNVGAPPIVTRNKRRNPLLPSSTLNVNALSNAPMDAGPIPKAFAANVRLNVGAPPIVPRNIRRNPLLPSSTLNVNALSNAPIDAGSIASTANTVATNVRVNVDSPPPMLASPPAKSDVAQPTAVNKQVDTQLAKDSSAHATPGPANVVSDATVATTSNGTGDSKVALGSASPKPAVSSDVSVYRVGIGDVLDVRLSDLPGENQTLFTVSAGGFLDHPLLDQPMKILGLTTDEVGVKLKEEMKKLAIESPRVTVAVRDYNSHTILVGGLVREHGTKILRREAIPLYVVLADAQPLPEAARVTVISHEGSNTAKVDLASPEVTKLLIRAGDVVMVQANPKLFFYIGGDVKEPGEKPYRDDLKLTQAILKAGGLNRDSNTAELAREGANGLLGLTLYKLSDINSGKIPDPSIQPGDRITIIR